MVKAACSLHGSGYTMLGLTTTSTGGGCGAVNKAMPNLQSPFSRRSAFPSLRVNTYKVDGS